MPRLRPCRLLLIVVTVSLLGLERSTPWGQDFLIESGKNLLEGRFEPRTMTSGAKVDGIVVLGGHAARSHAASQLAKLVPDAKIIVSGARPDEIAQLTHHGASITRLVLERRAENTRENAIFSLELANPKCDERWLLVTSATHMPRAAGTFWQHGFAVEPWPVFVSHVESGDASTVVLHELVGLLYYRWMGYTPTLLPDQYLLDKARKKNCR